MANEPSGFTIAEAADYCGVHERLIRRVLHQPEFAARLVTGTRLTSSGSRRMTLVPRNLLNDLVEHFKANVDRQASDSDSAESGLSHEAPVEPQLISRLQDLVQSLESRREDEVAFLRRQLEERSQMELELMRMLS